MITLDDKSTGCGFFSAWLRRPDLSIPRRAVHCVDQIFWQRADNGSHTLSYSQIVAPVIDISISNIYVPGQQTNFSAEAERYAVDLATAPSTTSLPNSSPASQATFMCASSSSSGLSTMSP
jgi:hypothetical protein